MIICFDTETTGLTEEDEIIQLSIADAETGAELLNRYYRPSDYLMERGWDEAASVTGIYPEDLIDCPSIYDETEHSEIQRILDRAELIVGYHVNYDVTMMERAGFDMSGYLYQDPMYSFAAYYWSTHPGEKHQKRNGEIRDPWLDWKDDGFGSKGTWISRNLTAAAEYFGYTDFGAHNSMNDVMATIVVWQNMNDKQVELSNNLAYDEDGNVIFDNEGIVYYIDENDNLCMTPDERAMDYVLTYNRYQLEERD